ncbi:MAG TPA: DUF2520 domain-containing protein [Nocardioidaceae bacterium]|nr:DUF2520 domain-containing protein [Nocardioidaceae bacterium]
MLFARRRLVPTADWNGKGELPMTGSRRTIGVIGAGRVGAVLAAALRTAGHTIAAVAGESDASRTRIETLLPGVRIDKPTAVAKACDVVLLTVPDDSLDNVVRMLVASGAIHPGQHIVHTSGRHGLDVLAPAAEIGAHGIAMHPAMTFTGTDVDLGRLGGCAFGVTAIADNRELAQTLVDDLGGQVMWIDEDKRVLYHAALAHGANHLVTLVAQAMDLLRDAGSTDPAATLAPLLGAALDNTLAYGDAALTGPIVRGDVQTVQAHLETMAASAPSTVETYVAMARATVNRAVVMGRLEPRRAADLIEVLDQGLALVRR